MRILVPLVLFAFVLMPFQIAAAGQIISGAAVVSDGDSLKIDQKRIRLFGIDAPEKGQTCLDKNGNVWSCGAAAQAQLAEYLRGQNVTCAVTGKDRYQRFLAICTLGKTDLNARMVSDGLALAYRRYSKSYAVQERQAKERQKGVWQGKFTAPWDWRSGQRKAELSEVAASGCVIKGNINSKGARIYHTPSSVWYSRTKVTLEKGERWFCSKKEALAAGWRAAR